eukprot:TRINITY_DN20121_c0_g1_i1.p1 TRINITY_DN20121_c0_g1~~TRINITY_DN20121_c0_g1_i1.p1  ORF type:complete len:307 (+),score=95.19 TRINITY_DN20121_c0_g1_i1:50-970(+)
MGSPWVGDSNQFGFRMLMKMGWTQGKGLGANEDGTVKPIVAVKNIENRGVGAKKSSDNWIQGASDFEKLLQRLNQANATEEKPESDESVDEKDSKKSGKSKKRNRKGESLGFVCEEDGNEVSETKSKVEEEDEEETKPQRTGPRIRYTKIMRAKGIIRSDHSEERLAEVFAVSRKEQLSLLVDDQDANSKEEVNSTQKSTIQDSKQKSKREYEVNDDEEVNEEPQRLGIGAQSASTRPISDSVGPDAEEQERKLKKKEKKERKRLEKEKIEQERKEKELEEKLAAEKAERKRLKKESKKRKQEDSS